MNTQDTYILKDINIGLSEIIDQRNRKLNPGATIILKNTLKNSNKIEFVETRVNITEIKEARPQYFQITGILSNDTKIGEYCYLNTSEFESYITSDMSHESGLPFLISTNMRRPRFDY